MDAQQLKERIEKELRRDSFPAELWEQLVAERYVAEVIEGEDPELCVNFARMLYNAWSAGRSNAKAAVAQPSPEMQTEKSRKVVPGLGSYEDERARAYSVHLANNAANHPSVRNFRSLYMQHGLLEQAKAEAVISGKKGIVPRSRLRSLCRRLAARYPWNVEEAMLFVLAGKVPEVAPLSGYTRLSGSEESPFSYGTVTLAVEPWISADSVADFYRQMQAAMLGRKPRKLEVRNLVLFRFVTERREKQGSTWRDLFGQWNELYPEGHAWHYKEVRNFTRDFHRAALVVPYPVTTQAYSNLRDQS